ncbi:hypothetical protein MMC11_001181 [Xylographa trunciseda]|nr:hypothetical protein [Xylographa trunciseda]
MNTFSRYFRTAEPSVTIQDASDSSSDEEGWDGPDLNTRPMVPKDSIDTTSEDEESKYDEDESVNTDDYDEEEPDNDDAFMDVERISVKLTPKNPARVLVELDKQSLRSETPPFPQRKTPSPPQRNTPMTLHPNYSSSDDSTDYNTDVGEDEQELDDEDSFISVDKITVKVTPKRATGTQMRPNKNPAHQKRLSNSGRKKPSPRQAKSVSLGKSLSPPDRSHDVASTSSSPLIRGKKPIPTLRASSSSLSPSLYGRKKPIDPAKITYIDSFTDSDQTICESWDPLPSAKSDNKQDLTERTNTANTGRRRPPKLPTQSPLPLPPKPSPKTPPGDTNGPKTPSSDGSPATPPIEEVLFSARVTRSQTARIRERNQNVHKTPRRVGLTALTYQGKQELPVYQNAYGGASRRVIYRPEPGKYVGQGVRKDNIGQKWRSRGPNPWDDDEGEEGENYEEDEDRSTDATGEDDGEEDEDMEDF